MTQENDDIIFEEIKRDTGASAQQQVAIKEPVQGDFASLYDELLFRCDPARFMEPYDSKKVSISNEIYAQIIQKKPSDEVLKELRSRAIKDLDVKFSTSHLYYDLLRVCDPKSFTGENYNKENLSLANHLYKDTIENADDIERLEMIQQMAAKLIEIDKKKEEAKRQKDGKEKQIADTKKEIEETKAKIADTNDDAVILLIGVFMVGTLFTLFAIIEFMELYIIVSWSFVGLFVVCMCVAFVKINKNRKSKEHELRVKLKILEHRLNILQ